MSLINRSTEFNCARQRNKTFTSNTSNTTNENPIHEAIRINEVEEKFIKDLFWGFVNTVVFIILYYDLIIGCSAPWTTFQLIEFCVAVPICVNILYYLVRYAWYFKTKSVQEISNDCSYNSSKSNESQLSLNLTAFSFDRSRRNESEINTSSLINLTPATSPTKPNEPFYCSSLDYSLKGKKFIETEAELKTYLEDYYTNEKFNTIPLPENKFHESSTPIWSHPLSTEPFTEQMNLAQNQYQLSYVVADNVTNKNQTTPLQFDEISFWTKKGIYSKQASYICDDLRVWISSTILSRIANEITYFNKYFMDHGYVNMRFGQTCFDKLKKCTNMQNIPKTINALLPFFELSNKQNYVIHRIAELSKSTCISDYRWNGGSQLYNGKPWDTHLPTDAEIIMHLISTYFDGQLLPLPQQPESKPFTAQYLNTNVSEKPIGAPGKIKIHQTEMYPPNYVVVEDVNVHAPQKGRNNLFHTLILFLHYVKTKHNGMLGGVSLGPAGINVLWIFGRD